MPVIRQTQMASRREAADPQDTTEAMRNVFKVRCTQSLYDGVVRAAKARGLRPSTWARVVWAEAINAPRQETAREEGNPRNV